MQPKPEPDRLSPQQQNEADDMLDAVNSLLSLAAPASSSASTTPPSTYSPPLSAASNSHTLQHHSIHILQSVELPTHSASSSASVQDQRVQDNDNQSLVNPAHLWPAGTPSSKSELIKIVPPNHVAYNITATPPPSILQHILPKPEKPKPQMPCPNEVCNEKFSSYSLVIKHIAEVCYKHIPVIDKSGTGGSCPVILAGTTDTVCGKKFNGNNWKVNLVTHFKTHEKNKDIKLEIWSMKVVCFLVRLVI
ncbi:UNVERIFIED_CONTAM: hypothetical protein HDU68_001442 [Siphonaria sp. JEL0065]|nr:hypothetical protein HDU68_001442 [Siphonaria sp. JEL0065]